MAFKQAILLEGEIYRNPFNYTEEYLFKKVTKTGYNFISTKTNKKVYSKNLYVRRSIAYGDIFNVEFSFNLKLKDVVLRDALRATLLLPPHDYEEGKDLEIEIRNLMGCEDVFKTFHYLHPVYVNNDDNPELMKLEDVEEYIYSNFNKKPLPSKIIPIDKTYRETIEHLENVLLIVHHAFANDKMNLTPKQIDAIESVDVNLELRGKLNYKSKS